MKDLFFYPKNSIYLSSHSVGLRPKKNKFSNMFYNDWQNLGSDAWYKWLDNLDQCITMLANFLHTSSDQICPQVNVSSAISKILTSFYHKKKLKKNTILMSEKDFPTIFHAISGVWNNKIKKLPLSFDINNLDAWDKQLTSDTFLVHLTYATSHSGEILPVQQICQLCKQKKIITIVDIAQAVGIIPLNLEKLGADFVVGSSIKWLCGGPGACFLWVKKNLIPQCLPRDRGWFSQQDPFKNDSNNFIFANNAKRFLGGTPNIIPFLNLMDSLEVLDNIGIQSIWQHNQKLTHELKLGLQQLKYEYLQTNHPSATTIIKNSNKISNAFKLNNVIFDVCKNGIRISFHIYNDQNDITKILKIISSNNLI